MAIRNKFSAKTGAVLTTVLFSLIAIKAIAQVPTLSVEHGKVWVRGLEPEVLYTFSRYFNSQKDWESVFPVTLTENIDGIVVNGSYDVFHDAISFTPRYPFAPNVSYKANFFSDQLAHNTNEVYLPAMNPTTLQIEFSTITTAKTRASVTHVYPSADVLPENLLKFHICFSTSMTAGEAYTRIKLFDSNGNEIEKPFLVVDQELWDSEMQTLTILLDPGRIKRGLRPNLEMKPALQQNNQFSLVIDKGWKDINGNTTTKAFVKSFTCASADRTAPDVSQYRIMAPQFATSSLMIALNEPIDYVLLQGAIRVTDSAGNRIEGTLYSRQKEAVIEFVPKQPWSETHYTIEFNPLLEDLAGNNLNRLFDTDLTSPQGKILPLTTISFALAARVK